VSYTTTEKLERRLPESVLAQLTTDSGTNPDDSMLEEVLAEVDGLIDTAANTGGYATPVVTDNPATKAALESHELSIAKFLILDRRGMTAYDPASETLYKAANAFLAGLAKGDIELAGAAAKGVSQSSSGSILGGSERRFFGRSLGRCDPMKGI
jgi:phage gp36-like protein